MPLSVFEYVWDVFKFVHVSTSKKGFFFKVCTWLCAVIMQYEFAVQTAVLILIEKMAYFVKQNIG